MKTKYKKPTWNPEFANAVIREHGRTREWLAPRVGVTKASLGQILTGRKPGSQTLKLLAQTLGCSESELWGDQAAS